jgi:sugar phosphate isomerase/epimerase
MKTASILKALAIFLALAIGLSIQSQAFSADEKPLNWRVGPASYSFNRFTFFEAIDKAKSIGMNFIEVFEGHKICPDSDEKVARGMSDESIAAVRKKLDDSGVMLTSIYIPEIPGDEAGCRAAFELAKKLGVRAIISEPKPEAFDTIEKFCKQYKIAVAIHNHPKPSFYWNPETVLKVCEGRSKWIGACADIGHWQRSGICPIDGIKKLGNRIISTHIKDLNRFGDPKSHDVPWGTGVGGLKEVFAEIDRLGLEPVIFGVEYEHNWENSLPEIDQCGKFFHKTAKELGNRPQ